MDTRDHQPAKGLGPFIAAARAQPLVGTRVTAEAVAAGLEHRRRRSHARRIVMLSASVALAASVVAAALIWPLLSSRGGLEREADDPRQVAAVDGSELPDEPAPMLAGAVRLRSTADVEIRGPWSIALREGTHEIELDATADHALAIALPERTLELVEGRVTIELGPDSELVAVRLHTGVAAWVDEHGRSEISVDRFDVADQRAPGDPPAVEPPAPPSAAALARQAEQQLAAGKREEAVATYQQLVRKHPRASQTRAAVLDLARLLRISGRTDEARCAYRLYLERWPNSSVRGEVESQLDRLGVGPSCRGLRPN